ncbi:preprotein translocase subunit SecA [Ethanoligenens harbinense]|uniref:Protein translocase subunit SecA n=1 Tax=Ethanoligenens harbinense (strain DSM 18485 / JCM 12961 / CGMCC 1.5033 / YUAN-3) TaxID=663278 RepID=E6U7P6_ETHHY|nr:preprotein translocase subunit SecA [Ethanoligenens harbinense]ADU28169.1 preprotein translocase, SecA subunit [Ethanoligenens harbinense YUAN-3]AVQ97173.1 preprotein translocase subunit SecA [Ethanoligenens harbinense YUAN-3]AYF39836.1 preprotein translocase subunit SecA [Ethanoligenens harbinense]AYF42668.1 preprotein translocase subunit SecA [Ethanoligenens harbinense]QCN93417.1 preprotein translocase subunit SecA [Ethanoligenens harbinense]
MNIIEHIIGSHSKRELKKIRPIADAVLALEDTYKAMSEHELKAVTPALKERLANGESLDDILPDAFAAAREAADRVLGMRHFPVQIIGGIILHQGRIAEMKTGEGKTLVATLPAYLNALEGKGVHIVTVNDYLAKRDSDWMGKLYRYMGLSVGLISHDLPGDARRAAYAADITYGTNNELGFDYLRDNMVLYKEQMVQRGFHFGVVDEVDSILIDEARTPLIISGPGDKSTEMYDRADQLVRTFTVKKVRELDDKESNEEIEQEGDYIVDEKAKTATLTPSGVKKAELFFGLENLMDSEHIDILHHINQAIRAHGIMKRDVDYVVRDGQVVIVDEFTGRLMLGRRYNEGLHQAIEAKEHVKVERESKTLATITFQNFFRQYKKLSGMTGTALTEQEEFEEIYKLDVLEIPTNRDMIRVDHHDAVYKSEKGKFNAVIEQIVESHEVGQPVLVGTISIEKSELLSQMLKQRQIPHSVLNAKYHEKEAEIVAQAGKRGAVTIATNMAGRGTDIVLGGNAEYMAKAEMRKQKFPEELISEATGYAETEDEQILHAREAYKELHDKFRGKTEAEAEEVRAAGGLFIIGTERHESRRIDNQLRGRAGRQGDPGESRFYISLEDDLMRLFGGERIQGLMDTLGLDDDVPIENRLITNSIENAQRKVEGKNFGIRKNVLQFDDVMNRQREIIYGQRRRVLDGESMRDYVLGMVRESIESAFVQFVSGDVPDEWNLVGLRDYYMGWITKPDDYVYTRDELAALEKNEMLQKLIDRTAALYGAREEAFGEDVMRELERVIILRVVDEKWMDHIDAMDALRQGMYLRAYGQKDPVVEYRIEGFQMFEEMIGSIREDVVRLLLTVQIHRQEEPVRQPVTPVQNTQHVGTPTSGTDDGPVKKMPIHVGKKPGRNDPCPCGSGKKYKNCCGRDD